MSDTPVNVYRCTLFFAVRLKFTVIVTVFDCYGRRIKMISNRDSHTWVIYTACCLVTFLDFSVLSAFGTLFVKLLEKYGESRSTTATVQSILMGTTTASSVVSAIVVRRFGVARASLSGTFFLSGGFIFSYFAASVLQLDLLIGVMSGIGISLLLVSSTVVVRNCFEGAAKGIAMSVHTSFTGIGSLLYPYLLNVLVQSYGINGTFLILGGLYLNNILVSLLFFIYENQSLNKKQRKKAAANINTIESIYNTNRGAKKDAALYRKLTYLWRKIVTLMEFRYTIVLLAAPLVISSFESYLIVIDDIFVSKGFLTEDTVKQLTVFNVAKTAARALPIVYSKAKPETDHMTLLAFCSVSGCLGQLFILVSSNASLIYVGNILSGLAFGGVISSSVVAVANITSAELFGMGFGLLMTFVGILTHACGPLYGYIRDSKNSYAIAIALTASLSGISSILLSASVFNNMFKKCGRQSRNFDLESATPKTVEL